MKNLKFLKTIFTGELKELIQTQGLSMLKVLHQEVSKQWPIQGGGGAWGPAPPPLFFDFYFINTKFTSKK